MGRMSEGEVRDSAIYRWRERGYSWGWIAERYGIDLKEAQRAYLRAERTMRGEGR